MSKQKTRTIETGTLYRSAKLSNHDKDKRTFEISFSSEEPVERSGFFTDPFIEILSHDKEAVDLSWLNSKSAPFLLDHNPRQQVGVVESAEITNDKRGKSLIRFGNNPAANEAYQDVVDNIKSNISVGYQIKKMILEEEGEEKPVYRVTEWKPMEISLVSIPADQSVGVGRKSETDTNITTLILTKNNNNLNNQNIMSKEKQNNEIDLKNAKEQATASERQRSSSIYSLASKHGFEKEASSFVEDGKSVEEFRSYVLDNYENRQKEEEPEGKPLNLNRASKDDSLGLSDKDIDSYSFVRAIKAAANQDWSNAGFEKEVSDAVAKKTGNQARGFYIPSEIQQHQKRGLTVGTDVDGGYLKGTDHLGGSFIDMLYNKTIVKELGATILKNLQGNVEIPKKTGTTTAEWIGEDEEATESKMALGQLTLSPKTLTANTSFSRQLVLQSDPSVENLVRQDLATAMALGIDLAAINGSGAGNEPQGILGASGVSVHPLGANGGNISWAALVALETLIASNNADLGNLRYATNSNVNGELKITEKASGTARFLLENKQSNGYKVAVSNQIPSNLTKGTANAICSAMIFGNFSDLIIGEWGALDVLVNPYSESKKGKIIVSIFKSVDIKLRRAASFAVIKDILTQN